MTEFATPDGKPLEKTFFCPSCGNLLYQEKVTYDIRCTGGCIFLGGWVEVLSGMLRRSEQLMKGAVQLLRDTAELNRVLAPHADDPKGVMDLAEKCDTYADRFLAVGNDVTLFGDKG